MSARSSDRRLEGGCADTVKAIRTVCKRLEGLCKQIPLGDTSKTRALIVDLEIPLETAEVALKDHRAAFDDCALETRLLMKGLREIGEIARGDGSSS